MMSVKGVLLVPFLSLFGVVVLVNCLGHGNMESEARVVGGWQERSPDDNEIQEMLPSILTKVNQQSNDAYHLMPIKVLKVSSQVVAGMKYKMEIQVARSDCKKSSNEKIDLKTCKKLEGHPDQIITLEVWEKAWEDFLQVNILETKLLS
ncbi:unnamed protein product [Litomosoides sigmodontis]|uniref:Ls-cystatin n=1 Tax=Litomosoides sigmodontis TaxID=42156 RepID=Q9NH95_LITSI|nr:Ls-cystatin precursor [Litomosoides sigmodontis]VDK75566.1 unnamed protein product [Litomosoides sigmodontis]